MRPLSATAKDEHAARKVAASRGNRQGMKPRAGIRRGVPRMIVLDGTALTCAEVAAIGRRLAPVEIGEEGRARASAAAIAARAAAEDAVASGGAVYGRTTGGGYNRGLEVAAED